MCDCEMPDYDDEDENWVEQESWLKIVCQEPLKYEVVEKVEEAT